MPAAPVLGAVQMLFPYPTMSFARAMISRSSVALRTAQSTRRAMSTQPSMWTPNEEAAKRFVEARHETFEHAGSTWRPWASC